MKNIHSLIFGGCMKTISFQIEATLLFDRKKDQKEAQKIGIEAIGLVVCNLYPFQKILEKGAPHYKMKKL